MGVGFRFGRHDASLRITAHHCGRLDCPPRQARLSTAEGSSVRCGRSTCPLRKVRLFVAAGPPVHCGRFVCSLRQALLSTAAGSSVRCGRPSCPLRKVRLFVAADPPRRSTPQFDLYGSFSGRTYTSILLRSSVPERRFPEMG